MFFSFHFLSSARRAKSEIVFIYLHFPTAFATISIFRWLQMIKSEKL